MDAASTLEPAPSPTATPTDPKREACLLEALRRAITQPGEHRLFRSGKLDGLFPNRTSVSSETAHDALTMGLLETLRTEVKGKFLTEWVRITPKGVAFVHDHDSPKVILAEFAEMLQSARTGIPNWLAETRQEIATLSDRFEQQATEILARLDALTQRLDAAVRRAEMDHHSIASASPSATRWADAALAYLDRRSDVGARGACPLGELFHAVREHHPSLTVLEFHTGLQRLHDLRALRLLPSSGDHGSTADPEYAMIVGKDVCLFAQR